MNIKRELSNVGLSIFVRVQKGGGNGRMGIEYRRSIMERKE